MDSYERNVAAERPGIYESHYLKLVDPAAERAVWLKHTLLRRTAGLEIAEFWAIRYRRGEPPVVTKREVPLSEVRADPHAVAVDAGPISLRPDRARGAIADARWDLTMSFGQDPLFHFPYAWMYTGGFPKKKIVTPAPGLRFDGEFALGGETWAVEGWRGMRGHNWGPEHIHTYGYGTVHQWDDGASGRVVEGGSGRLLLGGRVTPWLSVVVGREPDVRKNHLRHLVATSVEVRPDRWSVAWTRTRQRVSLELWADPAEQAGLRYLHPNGRVSYCYSSKIALGAYTVGERSFTTRAGELEVLFPEPAPGIPLHPTPDWNQVDGDYRSGVSGGRSPPSDPSRGVPGGQSPPSDRSA